VYVSIRIEGQKADLHSRLALAVILWFRRHGFRQPKPESYESCPILPEKKTMHVIFNDLRENYEDKNSSNKSSTM